MPGTNAVIFTRSISLMIITSFALCSGAALLGNTARATDLVDDETQETQLTDVQVSALIDKTLGDHKAYQALFLDLKEAVNSDNRQQVADLMSYPLDAEIDGNPVTVDGASMFLAFYDKIMIPETISIIQSTAYSDLSVSYEGLMLGDGQVWINAICKNETCSEVEVLVSSLQKGLE